MNFSEALSELRKSKSRKFDQTLDLIINLKDFDPKREAFTKVVELPFEGKPRKICAILEKAFAFPGLDLCLTKSELEEMDSKKAKKLADQYDWFICSASLMPALAAKLGKALGPRGKMPDPALGAVLTKVDKEAIASICKKLKKSVKVKVKEASIKIPIGKESMPDEQLEANAKAAFNAVIEALPKKAANLKCVLLKLTMSAPLKIDWKNDKT